MEQPVEVRDIPGFPGYMADSQGRIVSRRGHAMKPTGHTDGYPIIKLRRGGKRVTKTIHGLVLLAFKGPRPDGLQARHLDGDRSNAAPANLEWGTAVENAADAVRHGTLGKGALGRNVRLNERLVREVREKAASGIGERLIARELGVSEGCIFGVVSRRTWCMVE